MLTSIEICAGAGGQALGLSNAGFEHMALVEYEKDYCDTLKRNRPEWNVICGDVREFDGWPYRFKLTFLQEVSRVLRSPSPVNSSVRMTRGICFRRCSGLWKK